MQGTDVVLVSLGNVTGNATGNAAIRLRRKPDPVAERVIVRKRTTIDEHRLQTELRREHVTTETEGDVDFAPEGSATSASGGVA